MRCLATVIGESGLEAQAALIIVSGCQVIVETYALRLNSRAGTEGSTSTVSSLICDHWLILGSETRFLSEITFSSSHMRVMNHIWSTTKQHLHPQSVAEISRHSVLSGDRIRQCQTSFGSRHKDTDQCL